MRVHLKKSPRFDKKFRVIFENEREIDFGAKGYSDYTKHKNPIRMRSYVSRHGGFVPHMVQKQTDPLTSRKQPAQRELAPEQGISNTNV